MVPQYLKLKLLLAPRLQLGKKSPAIMLWLFTKKKKKNCLELSFVGNYYAYKHIPLTWYLKYLSFFFFLNHQGLTMWPCHENWSKLKYLHWGASGFFGPFVAWSLTGAWCSRMIFQFSELKVIKIMLELNSGVSEAMHKVLRTLPGTC